MTDRYHDRVGVNAGVSSAGNHLHALGEIRGAASAVTVSGSSTGQPHAGATAIRNSFDGSPPGANVGGFYFLTGVLPDPGPPLNPLKPGPNFGTVPNAGINRTGATAVTFWVRGKRGGGRIDFFAGGVGRNATTGKPTAPYPAGFEQGAFVRPVTARPGRCCREGEEPPFDGPPRAAHNKVRRGGPAGRSPSLSHTSLSQPAERPCDPSRSCAC